ncbi:hypothetical protein DAI22_07g273750 [Oryza sativa Japonica Group]|nr:hypothetical protein DAI22_07g273750 [Oryza sativa Japonica Group]
MSETSHELRSGTPARPFVSSLHLPPSVVLQSQAAELQLCTIMKLPLTASTQAIAVTRTRARQRLRELRPTARVAADHRNKAQEKRRRPVAPGHGANGTGPGGGQVHGCMQSLACKYSGPIQRPGHMATVPTCTLVISA